MEALDLRGSHIVKYLIGSVKYFLMKIFGKDSVLEGDTARTRDEYWVLDGAWRKWEAT